MKILELALKIDAPLITETSPNYRPPSWPPPSDWPIVLDKKGHAVSHWGDPIWDLSPWHGSRIQLAFGDANDRQGSVIADNAELLRQAIGWLIFGPRGYRKCGTIKNTFSTLWNVVALCNENNVRISALQRHPILIENLINFIAPSRWEKTISILHRIYEVRDSLGFFILDESGIKRLAEAAEKYEQVQTPYIPPRIWMYQVRRLRECIEEFMAYRVEIESCFRYCISAYTKNYKTLTAALGQKNKSRGPFTRGNDPQRKRHYIGPFSETAKKFGIEDLIRRWVVGWKNTRVSMLSSYLSLVTYAGQLYIANFTLQRREEVNALRTDCLVWESSANFERILLVRGETTKTESNSDARWVASPSIEIAVNALSLIARLRMECDKFNPRVQPSPADIASPYLSSTPTEPWGFGIGKAKSYDIRNELNSIKDSFKQYPLLFDKEQLRITNEDLKIARKLTRNLDEKEFAVGQFWPLAWHQFRRTGAVNMAASGLISDASLQHQLKHANRLMSLYYARGHTDLLLNEEVSQSVITASYEAMTAKLQEVVSDRFISPHSPERKQALVVNILRAKDVRELKAWAKVGKVSFRETRLGGCMKQGPCAYGGIESVSHCAGGDGKVPCMDALFDKERAPQVRVQVQRTTEQMAQLSSEHPRYNALKRELQAMENYLHVISSSR